VGSAGCIHEMTSKMMARGGETGERHGSASSKSQAASSKQQIASSKQQAREGERFRARHRGREAESTHTSTLINTHTHALARAHTRIYKRTRGGVRGVSVHTRTHAHTHTRTHAHSIPEGCMGSSPLIERQRGREHAHTRTRTRHTPYLRFVWVLAPFPCLYWP